MYIVLHHFIVMYNHIDIQLDFLSKLLLPHLLITLFLNLYQIPVV